MEREVGGGIGMGNTGKPMAVSFQCMTKSTAIKKKIKKKDIGWLTRQVKKQKTETETHLHAAYKRHILYLKTHKD